MAYFDAARKDENGYGQMFPRRVDFSSEKEWERETDMTSRWIQTDDKCNDQSDKKSTAHTHIMRLTNVLTETLSQIGQLDDQLWKKDSHWQSFDKLHRHYCTLYDIFGYFACNSGRMDEMKEVKNNHNYSLWDSIWRYFEETIVSWLLVKFLDKLPKTQDFIGNFKRNDIINYEKEGYHTDFGNVSFFEFFIEFKTRCAMMFPFHNYTNFHLYLYRSHGYDTDLAYETFAKHGLAVTFYHLLQSESYHFLVGAFRMVYFEQFFFNQQ